MDCGSDARDATEVRWLDDEQLAHWMPFAAVLQLLPGSLDGYLRRVDGITHFDYLILAGLCDRPDRTMGMSDLAACASGSLSRLSHALDRLEARGWVRRSPTGNGRAVEVALTGDGRAAMERIAPGYVAEVRRLVIDVVAPDQLAAMGAASRAMLSALDPRHTELLDDLLRAKADAAAEERPSGPATDR